MSPFIRDGDVITIAPAPTHFRLGDVVAFVNPINDRLTVHRIVQLCNCDYQIRGDNVQKADGYVSQEHILGRVVSVERSGRHVRIGMGPERVALAFLSRQGWTVPLMVLIRRFFSLA